MAPRLPSYEIGIGSSCGNRLIYAYARHLVYARCQPWGVPLIRDNLLRRLTSVPGVRTLWSKFPLGNLSTRVQYGVLQRPHYAYGIFQAADLARRLQLPGISVIEFGVAGGRGLRAMEDLAEEVARHFNIRITVVGFDSGTGMPPAVDYRDLPHVWEQGFFMMDQEKLRKELRPSTQLILGAVENTVGKFLNAGTIDPVGFVAFDLDYYSSTMQAFEIFDDAWSTRLPRVYCYFDDILYPPIACHNEYTGELCAIRDFNSAHDTRKICVFHLLRHYFPHSSTWHDQIYVMHDFKHPLYNVNITPKDEFTSRELPL